MILILTDASDAHADSVIEHLLHLNADTFRFSLDKEALLTTLFSHEYGKFVISQGDKVLRADSVKCVWARRLTIVTSSEEESDTSSGFRMWRGEWNRCLFGLYANLRRCFWLNSIYPSTLMDNKFYQFDKAKQCGFDIPDIITSNKKSSLIEFATTHKEVALKFMSQDIYKSENGESLGLYVNKLTRSDLDNFGTSRENPVSLQPYVAKQYEVRLTFVDGQSFACRIDSQSSSKADIDWRRYDIASTPHYPIEPPPHIANLMEKFMTEVSLSYGAFDFIVDPDDKWWYLEVNSAGQWLWIEDLVQLPISAAIAKCLTRKALEPGI